MNIEKSGLTIFIASLLVIATISWFSFEYHRVSRLSQIRSQGASLAKSLSMVGWQQLVSSDPSRSAVHLIQSVHPRLAFAYVAVTDPQGKVLIEATDPSVGVPFAPLANEPASWYGERTLLGQGASQEFRELHAPGNRSHPTHLKPEIEGRRDCVQCLGSCRERGRVASLSPKANHFGQVLSKGTHRVGGRCQ